VYNPTVVGFQSFGQSFMAVLRFSVGDFDYNALSAESPLVTPLLFSLLLVVIFFIWVNLVRLLGAVPGMECALCGALPSPTCCR